MSIIPYQIPSFPRQPPQVTRIYGLDSCPAGPYFPTQAINVATGDVAWTNPGNVLVSDDTYATCVTVAQTSQQLQATGFNFQIDAFSKQVNGIIVEVEAKCLASTDTLTCRIIKGGAVSSTSIDQTVTTSEAFVSYGSATNLWGETWTPYDVNAGNFGVCMRQEGGVSATLSIDSVRITIYCGARADTILQSPASPWPARGGFAPIIAQ